jgi:hypothetical protein
MISMDIFRGGASGGAFSAITLTTAIRDLKYTPSLLTSMPGLITKIPVRTAKFAVERMADTQRLIPVTERGAPRSRQTRDRRNIRDFRTLRTAKMDELRAVELADIRAFGSETELEAVQAELAMRFLKLRRDHELTEENRLLGMIQGNVLDADGSATLYNWFTEFGITPPSKATSTGRLRRNFALVWQRHIRHSLTVMLNGSTIAAQRTAITSTRALHRISAVSSQSACLTCSRKSSRQMMRIWSSSTDSVRSITRVRFLTHPATMRSSN